jgi:hypothetical protein
MNHFDPGHHLEQLAAYMAGSSDAGRPETDLARIGLGVGAARSRAAKYFGGRSADTTAEAWVWFQWPRGAWR